MIPPTLWAKGPVCWVAGTAMAKPDREKPAVEMYLKLPWVTGFEFKGLVVLSRKMDLKELLVSHMVTFSHWPACSIAPSQNSAQERRAWPCHVRHTVLPVRRAGKKDKCTGPQSVPFALSSAQRLLAEEDLVPTKCGRECLSSFTPLVKKIPKYSHQVLARLLVPLQGHAGPGAARALVDTVCPLLPPLQGVPPAQPQRQRSRGPPARGAVRLWGCVGSARATGRRTCPTGVHTCGLTGVRGPAWVCAHVLGSLTGGLRDCAARCPRTSPSRARDKKLVAGAFDRSPRVVFLMNGWMPPVRRTLWTSFIRSTSIYGTALVS